MSDTHNKLHYGNKQYQWKMLNFILDFIIFRFLTVT